jgi:hypothetical protein
MIKFDQDGPEEERKAAWKFLRQEIPKGHPARKELDKSVYGTSGLSDIAEWFLWELLEQSGLRWELHVSKVQYLGSEQRRTPRTNFQTKQKEVVDITWHLVSAEGTLLVDGRPFPCFGASDNRRLDAAYKGALTSLFKNGCKWAGLTMSLYKEGAIVDEMPAAEIEPAAVEVQSRSASISTDGASTNPPKPESNPTLEEFEKDPVNVERMAILEEFNRQLPKPNADQYVRAMIANWLLRSEQDGLTDEMKSNKTGGSALNWVFQLLCTQHAKQCNKCNHNQETFDKLRMAGQANE